MAMAQYELLQLKDESDEVAVTVTLANAVLHEFLGMSSSVGEGEHS
jgi:hypothetical protein